MQITLPSLPSEGLRWELLAIQLVITSSNRKKVQLPFLISGKYTPIDLQLLLMDLNFFKES